MLWQAHFHVPCLASWTLSRGIYGHEGDHLMLRLLTTLELLEHRHYYDPESPDHVDLIEDPRIVTTPYTQAPADAATPGHYSDMTHIHATSAVLGKALCSYCPNTVNLYAVSGPLTRKVCGRGVSESADPVLTLMWSQASVPRRLTDFHPNHLVPLHRKPAMEEYVDLTATPKPVYATPLQPCASQVQTWRRFQMISRTRLCHKYTQRHHLSTLTTVGLYTFTHTSPTVNITPARQWQTQTSPHRSHALSDTLQHSISITTDRPALAHEHHCWSTYISRNHRSIIIQCTNYRNNGQHQHNETDHAKRNTWNLADCIWWPNIAMREREAHVPRCNRHHPRNHYHRRSIKIHSYRHERKQILRFDNIRNYARRARGLKSEFVDDCGVWSSSPSPSTFYPCNTPGRLQIIHKRHGQYCKELMVTYKKTYPPLEPQPSANDTLSVHRNYNKLKANPHYKRRITWINIGSDIQHTTAVAEYLGTYPGQYPHGNSKYNAQGYSRTSASVLEAIGEQCNSTKPNHVFIHMNNNNSELHRPSNLKQVQNEK